MKILHLTTSFPATEEDSSGIFVQRLVMAQKNDHSIQVKVVTPSSKISSSYLSDIVSRFRYAPQKIQTLAQTPGGIPVALKKNPLLYSLVPIFLTSMAISLIKNTYKYDVIHAHWSISGAIAVLTQRIHKLPIVLTLRGEDQNRSNKKGVYSWLHQQALEKSAKIVVVSNAMSKQLYAQHKEMNKKTHTVYNGVSDDFYQIERLSCYEKTAVQFIAIGSLIPRKGYEVIINAFAQIESNLDWTLSIVGNGAELADLQALSKKYHLSNKITFLNNTPPDEIATLLASHHILILASFSEGRPNVVLEAMAAEMPVIGSDIDGNRELIQHNSTGYLFPVGDSLALSKKIVSFIADQSTIKVMGKKSREWMQTQQLTWEQTSSAYKTLYEAVL